MKLELLIKVLNEEEIPKFIQYLTRLNKRKDAKNIELFQLLRNNHPTKEIPQKLYGSDNKRAYHALRIRLQKNVIDFLGQDGLQSEALEEVAIYKLVFLGRKFLQKQHYEVGIEFLLLAEEKAARVQHYVLLNEIYHSLVQYSYTTDKLDVEKVIQTHAANGSFLIQEERLNVVYAVVQNRLKEHLHGKRTEIEDNLISNLIEEYKIDLSSFTTYKALFQYIKIFLAVARVKNDYYGFIESIEKQYQYVREVQEDSDRQLFYHTRFLYSMANTFFRSKNFDKCGEYVLILKTLMDAKNFTYKERFQYKYTIMASLNANYSGRNAEAIAMLDAINFKKVQNFRDKCELTSIYILYLMHGEEFKKAKRFISSLFHTDKYYEDRMGIDWLMKFKLIEIILYFELEENDLLESRIRSFKRLFIPYLTKQKDFRVIQFFKLVEKMFLQPELLLQPDFLSKVESSFEITDSIKNEDVFVQSYYGWMKAKILNQDLYQTTLDLAKI